MKTGGLLRVIVENIHPLSLGVDKTPVEQYSIIRAGLHKHTQRPEPIYKRREKKELVNGVVEKRREECYEKRPNGEDDYEMLYMPNGK